mgnify:FL=1
MVFCDWDEYLEWEKTTKDAIDFKRSYADIAGDVLAGLMLSELIFWYLPDKKGKPSKLTIEHDGEKWIAVRRYEWWERTRMSPRQCDRAIVILINADLVEKRLFKFYGDPTIHLRIKKPIYLKRLQDVLENPPKNPYLPGNEGKETQCEPEPTDVNSISPNGEKEITESGIVNSISRIGENGITNPLERFPESVNSSNRDNNTEYNSSIKTEPPTPDTGVGNSKNQDAPERLWELDEESYACFNRIKQKYEEKKGMALGKGPRWKLRCHIKDHGPLSEREIKLTLALLEHIPFHLLKPQHPWEIIQLTKYFDVSLIAQEAREIRSEEVRIDWIGFLRSRVEAVTDQQEWDQYLQDQQERDRELELIFREMGYAEDAG